MKPMRAKCALCGRVCPVRIKRVKLTKHGEPVVGYYPYKHSHTGCRDGQYDYAIPFITTRKLGLVVMPPLKRPETGATDAQIAKSVADQWDAINLHIERLKMHQKRYAVGSWNHYVMGLDILRWQHTYDILGSNLAGKTVQTS